MSSPLDPRPSGDPGERLESWKAIAAFLNRGITTVQRWEREEGLPVHRLQHDALGSVFAFTQELETWRSSRALRPASAPGVPARRIRAIVVLPFENLSDDPDQVYLADAMTDALTTALARLNGPAVTSRSTAMQHRRLARPLPEIARELGVDAVIEGSLLRVSSGVRITAQLIEAATDRHLWARSYDGPIADILRLQSDVASAIAAEIGGLTRERPSESRPSRAVNPRAYDAYIRGMFHLRKFTRAGFDRALSYFNQASAEDPADPLPWAGLAFAYGMISHCDLPARQPGEAFAQVTAAANRALELDDGLAEAHVALAGQKLYYEWDWASAARGFERALALNPTLAEAHRHYGWYLFLSNRPDEAVAALRRAREAEPLAPLYASELGWAYWMLRRTEEAQVEAARACELDSDFPVGLFVTGALLRDGGRFDEAIVVHERAAAISPGWGWALGETYALAGRADLARAVIASTNGGEPPDAWDAFTLAYVSAALGDSDSAMRGLEAMYRHRHGWTPWVCRGIMAFARVVEHPRFQDVAKRVRLPV